MTVVAAYDFRAPRLFVDAPLSAGARVALGRDHVNYLRNVLRLKSGGGVLVFNGRDGEWRSRVADVGGKAADLVIGARTREQTPVTDLVFCFAPLKAARLDYMVQKAVEMGAGRLTPVYTRRTQAARVNLERMRANAIEAAEQCGILSIPMVEPDADLTSVLGRMEPDRLVVFCDEDAPLADPVRALAEARTDPVKAAVIVGPEGGFDDAERSRLGALPRVVRISLGPRILRADTAAVAALALVQAVLGDWRGPEPTRDR
jgi:16S rRNA (uracil1498-N3)-methyltransferase